ncbi:MAG TPA: TPM domain-containing protein [Prolixibacteraceae bacterium]|nr:TPM domain-containing protein [Prolixibacteraceae bacterium]
MKTKTILIGFLLSLFVLTGYAQNSITAEVKFPDRRGYVNDFEGILSSEQVKELNDLVANHEKETSHEIVLVTIGSFEPYPSLFDYSYALANDWGVGKKDKNNGIAIVMGKQIRQIRIQVGYGLENKLKDEEAKRIIDHTIVPEFKKGDYYAGIKMGLAEIINEIK